MVQIVEAIATSTFATRSASRKIPVKEKAAIASIAVRVTTGENPVIFHHSASHAITSGGCAFDGVEWGIRLPEYSRSRAAGT